MTADPAGELLWFAPDHRLRHFANLAALTEFLTSAPGREMLRPALSIGDQPVLQQEGVLRIEREDILTSLAADRVDSIIARQARNLAHAVTVPCPSDQVMVMIDDALDVRPLLDPRQLPFGAGRWREAAPYDFATIWAEPTTPSASPQAQASSTPAVEAAAEPASTSTEVAQSSVASGPARSQSTSWTEFAQAFDSRAEQLLTLHNALTRSAAQVLDAYLCVLLGPTVRAQAVEVQWLESVPADQPDVESDSVSVSESLHVVTKDLVSLFIDCVTQYRAPVLAGSTQLKLASASSAIHLDVGLIHHVLAGAMRDFGLRYVSDFERSRYQTRLQGNRQSRPSLQARNVREDALRLDLALAKRQGRIDSTAVTLARQVLDRPIRTLRLALGTPVTEAYAVSLSIAGRPGIALCDTLAFQQPSNPQGPLLLWTCDYGWRQFSSLEGLTGTLRFNLQNENRERWLALVGEGDRRMLRAHLHAATVASVGVELTRIDGHVTRALQNAVRDRQQQDLAELCKRAQRCRYDADLFIHLAGATEMDGQLLDLLDGLSVRIDNSIFEAMLPSWVSKASIPDLMAYYNIFQHYYQTNTDGKDFLFGVPTLEDLARQRLTATLKRDFPSESFNPSQINVTSRRYVSALPPAGEVPSSIPAATEVRTESLIDYAINRYIDEQDASLSVQVVVPPHGTASLTPDYLRTLVREVDIGAAYMRLLRKAFTPTDAHYGQRRRLFVQQLPPALLSVALPLKVEGSLSVKAYDFIARVLDMPDGIAREPVDGTWVILSPLQLVADADMSPDVVTGVYLICPSDATAGPVVVYAIYHNDFVFREYPSREALTQAIRTDSRLQQLLLERVAPEVRRRYAHGGFAEPHLPFTVEGFNNLPVRAPGPVTLDIAQIKGNALQSFFNGTLELLLKMGKSNAVSNVQADREGRRFLATLALSQALTLLPNKLAALVTLWQSHTLLRASAVSASRHRWGKALSEFTAALGVVVTVREQSLEETSPDEDPRPGVAPLTDEAESAVSPYAWSRATLTAEQRLRLQSLEAQNVALDDMRHDELLNLYFDKEEQTPYSVVDGRVYQVRQLGSQGRWMIVGADGAPGPHILLDGNQHWRLDLDQGLRGGGSIVTRVLDSVATAGAEHGLVIEATGMSEIRQLYRYRARSIADAHSLAQQYLENCLDNLNARLPDGTLDTRTVSLIGDYFGTPQPDQALLDRLQDAARAILDAVMDPSFSPFTSSRIVIGTNRPDRHDVTAFVIPLDPQRRVFLTDKFFRPPRYRLKPAASLEGFDATRHFQATTLIHELSHLALGTKDIVYLESNAPFMDLLRDGTAANVRARASIERLQDYRLSHRTPKHELFVQQEDGHWRDVRREDALGYTTVLRITGAKTLDEARTIFLADVDKRSQIMLKNADSLTLLLVRLGRRNFTALNP